MPAAIKRTVTILTLALMAGAAYLIVVRGEALLADLAALGSKVWCF